MEMPLLSRFSKIGETLDQSNTLDFCEAIKDKNICVNNDEESEYIEAAW